MARKRRRIFYPNFDCCRGPGLKWWWRKGRDEGEGTRRAGTDAPYLNEGKKAAALVRREFSRFQRLPDVFPEGKTKTKKNQTEK